MADLKSNTRSLSARSRRYEELATLNDRRVIAQLRSFMVARVPQMRAWDYGAAGDAYPCWLVLAQKSQNTGIAYCESGFGPRMPWGLLFLEGTEHMSMGMDSGWFDRFLDAYGRVCTYVASNTP